MKLSFALSVSVCSLVTTAGFRVGQVAGLKQACREPVNGVGCLATVIAEGRSYSSRNKPLCSAEETAECPRKPLSSTETQRLLVKLG